MTCWRHCIDALLDRNPGVSPDEVEDVIVGAANHVGEQDGNIARLAVVLSKLPISVAGSTINRFCSSGLQSIAFAANQIASGQTQVAIGGGVDSISMRTRQDAGKSELNKILLEEKPDIFMAMGNTAEVVARRYQGDPRGSGRIRTAEPAALRQGPGGRVGRRRDRSHERHHAQGGQADRRSEQGGRGRRAGRVQPSHHHAGRGWPVCRRRSRKTAPSPPAMPPSSPTELP